MTTVSPDIVCAANDLLSRIASAIEPLTTSKKVSVFYHVELNRSLYYGAHYRRVTHRNSYTIAYICILVADRLVRYNTILPYHNLTLSQLC